MSLKMIRLSLVAVILLVMLVVVAACGKRGDPVPPGKAPEKIVVVP